MRLAIQRSSRVVPVRRYVLGPLEVDAVKGVVPECRQVDHDENADHHRHHDAHRESEPAYRSEAQHCGVDSRSQHCGEAENDKRCGASGTAQRERSR